MYKVKPALAIFKLCFLCRGKASNLQYADDTLFFCKASIQSVLTLKAILKCFKLASGLKVNYSKSKVGGVGVTLNQTMIFAFILNCDIMKAPFSYLGVHYKKIIK